MSRLLLTAILLMLAACDSSKDKAIQIAEDKPAPIPEFGAIPDVREKKKTFFDYLTPKVRAANDAVWRTRLELIRAKDRIDRSGSLPATEQSNVIALAERYGMEPAATLDAGYLNELLARVDVVPASLVLAQAAKESGWGTSRFAREGRNFFGIWCYQKGCGIEPGRRNAGASHEVRRFTTVQAGVNHYVHLINTGKAYGELRKIRAAQRAAGREPEGLALTPGLSFYSERRQAYVKEVSHMIKYNKLAAYNLSRNQDTQSTD